MCLYPKLIKNPKYTPTKKNGGVIPKMKDPRCEYVPIGCGKCIECMKKKANEWRVRLSEELKHNKNAYFVTLSFNDEAFEHLKGELEINGYELDNKVAQKGVRYFLERWRKKYKKSVKHWLVTELGGNNTERVHIHGIIWTDNPESIEERWNAGKQENGHVFIGTFVTMKTINYIVKYLHKADAKHEYYKPKIMCSAGIGADYIGSRNHENNYKGEGKTNEQYRMEDGRKVALPIYYRNYTYTDEDKEELWIEKLDKHERYVLGNKIDVSKTDTEYYARLNVARELNKRQGFGDNEIDWNKVQYEMERKAIVHARMKKNVTIKQIKNELNKKT